MTQVLVELAVLGAGGLALAAVAAWNALRQDRTIRFDVFVAACERLGLGRDGARGRGRVEGVPVVIEPHGRDAESDPHLWIEVDDPLRIDLELGPHRLADFTGVDVAVGEPRFDGPIRVHARDPFVAAALFDHPTREVVLAAIAEGGWFAAGRWQAELALHAGVDVDRVVRAVRAVARAHRALAAAIARPPEAALAAIADGDRHAGVRLRALELLIDRGIASRALLEARTKDLDPAIRHLAARALGPDGAEALRGLVREGSRTWRVRAACTLAAHRPTGAPAREAEDALIAALEDPALAREAAFGLARIGTARAVDPLLRWSDAAPTAEIRRAARDALGAVRARLDPAHAGALSLVAGELGALSEAAVDGGGVSVAERE